MSDTSLPVIIRFDTTANRLLFTPTPGVAEQLYIWLDSDDQPNSYYWDGAAWQAFSSGGGSGITELTGDVTAGPGSGSQAATIAANAVTDAKFRQSAALSVVARAANSIGDVADLVAAADDRILRRTGSTLNFGQLTAGMIPAATIVYAAIQNVADARLLGNFSGAPAAMSEYSLGAGLEHSGGAIGQKVVTRTQTIGITVDGGGSVVTTGQKGYRSFPVAGTITGWRLLADLAGDVDFDISLDPFASYPPTTSVLTPSLSGVDHDEATGLSQAVAAGDVFGFEITGTPATITRVTLELTVVVTG